MPKRFYGGIHPQHAWPPKEELLHDSGGFIDIRPARVVLPMQQGVGAPCTPLVKPGETVLLGQLVGASEEKLSSLVHSSVSGRVVDVGTYATLRGKEICVVVENDGKNTPLQGQHAAGDPFALTPEQIIEAVRRAGIVGMGGASFPTHVKLQPGTAVDTVIVNGCECEPMQAADDALLQQMPEMVLLGCRAAVKAVGAARAAIAIETNKPAAIAAVQRKLGESSTLRVVPLRTAYPQGGEKQLIEAVTGREVPTGGLPADAGVVVLNAATCAAIAEALCTGLPLVRRIITVTGDVKRPQNLRFPIGTTAAALIDACGGFAGTPSKVIAGGPMMGRTMPDLEMPMLKGSNGLIVVNERHDALFEESPCIRCNRCALACPMRLMPLFLDREARRDKLDFCERFGAQSCINCGCCTYVCPARRRLAETITAARGKILQRQKEAAQ